MSSIPDVSIVLTKPAEVDGSFVDQTLRNLEVVDSFDQAKGAWVMFAPAFFPYERHIVKNLLLAAESANADVVIGGIKGPWVATRVAADEFSDSTTEIPATHVLIRKSWLVSQDAVCADVVRGAEVFRVESLPQEARVMTIPQDVVAKPRKKAANPKAAKGSPFQNLPAMGYFIAKYLPLKNEVLFDVEGDRAVDSALPDLACDWKLLNPGIKQKWITPKLRNTWTHAWHLGRAKYLVTNEVFLNRIPKREGQMMAVAGVGIPVLRTGRDNPDWVLQPTSERRPAWSQVGRWDLVLAASPFAEQVLRSSTAYVSEVVSGTIFGDAMMKASATTSLKSELSIDSSRPLVVCAFFTSQSAPDLTKLEQVFGDRVQFVGVTDDCSTLRLPESIAQVATDLPKWLAAADVMITDWSALAMEFGRLQRPIIVIEPNRIDVVRRRGTYLDVHSQFPGPVVEDLDALIAAVSSWLDGEGSVANYAERRESFTELCGVSTGNAAQRLWDAMVKQS
ncbi:unannotated protein [freshwater metagenome]|uniref:Unannotated protein n=1 Tax=freshwater metagenome TaxID=449393 RepID=A0A6J6I491_9ZZZZ|nr:hypothetical protein [Actinomycetota bacterium]MSY37948.1 hypothetical protein [Actinomycetota bacterium]MSZ41345.1 hypothetical protein [Actinomycetota bacterium]